MVQKQSGKDSQEWIQSYNPEEEREDDFGFIGRVVQNEYAPCSAEYMEKANLTTPVMQWQMRLEALDIDREDGTPALFSNSLNLQAKDGRAIKGSGTPPFEVSVAFTGLGVAAAPNLGGDGIINHVFRFQRHNIKLGPTLRKSVYLPIEYLGDADYTYVGEKRTIKGKRDDQGASTRNAVAQAAELASQGDPDKARNLAEIINGLTREEARTTIKSHPVAHQVIFGQSVAIGFNPPKFTLLNILEERGFVTISEGGVIAAAAPVRA